jgi:uncharacterized protein YqjF (DUF2071 family)
VNRPFLTARWEDLVLLNWDCPRELLDPLVPAGTELDDWQGRHLVSLVGFMFRRTRVLGIAVPGHVTFAEVNLRFYVRRVVDGEIRRAVVFIRELVPRRAIAAVARRLYNEPYLAVPMSSTIALDSRTGGHVEYRWGHAGRTYRLSATASGAAMALARDSEAEYVTEHYWGYTRQRDGGTLEYRVDHPPWRVWAAAGPSFEGPAESLYGPGFARVLAGQPRSAHIAVGSAVAVYRGRRITP